MAQTEEDAGGQTHRDGVRLRRYAVDRAARDEARPPDIERVFDTYGIQNFTYRTWGRWEGGLPKAAAQRVSTTGGTMARAKQNQDGPYAWQMPEDLKAGRLPIISRMPDTTSLVANLKVGTTTRAARVAPAAAPAGAKPAVEVRAPEVQAQSQESNDARAALRALALKGQKNG